MVAVLTIENERAVCVHLFISASLVMRCGIIPLARNMSTVNKHVEYVELSGCTETSESKRKIRASKNGGPVLVESVCSGAENAI